MRCASLPGRDDDPSSSLPIAQPIPSTSQLVDDECARRSMALACAALVDNLGFSHCAATSLDTLSALSICYLEKFCLQLHNYTEQGGRTRPTINDAQHAFQKMRCDMQEITDYVTLTAQTRRTREPPLLPVIGSSSARDLAPNEPIPERDLLLMERGNHIPDWAPELYKKEITVELLETRRQKQREADRNRQEAFPDRSQLNDDFPDFLSKDIFSLGLHQATIKSEPPPFRSKIHQPLSIDVPETPQYASELLHHTILAGQSTASPRAPVLRLKIRKSDSCDVSSLAVSPFSPLTPTSAPPNFQQRDIFANDYHREGGLARVKEESGSTDSLASPRSVFSSQSQSPLPSPFQIPALPKKARGRPPKKVAIKKLPVKKEVPAALPLSGQDQNMVPENDVKSELHNERPKAVAPRRISAPLLSPMVLPERSTRAQKPRALSPPPPAPMMTTNRRKSFTPIAPLIPIGKPSPRTPLTANQPSILHTSKPLVSPITPTPIESETPTNRRRREHRPPKKYLDFESDLPPSLSGRKRTASGVDSSQDSSRFTQPPNKKAKQNRLSLPAKTTPFNQMPQQKKPPGRSSSRAINQRRVSLPNENLMEEAAPVRGPPLKLRISFGGASTRMTIDDPTLPSPEPRMAIDIDVGTKNEHEKGEARNLEQEKGQQLEANDADAENVADEGISPSIPDTLDNLLHQVDRNS
ncbi:unnamed protein product, partial [Mesorhabditis belari]|uniref:Bromodomain associated domain-containing protein n=1 Tax=Mesorhabditis belari TaxID=2138241 RepID=A0AAF3EZB1_9BILA